MIRQLVELILALSLLTGCASFLTNQDPLDILFPYQPLNAIELVDFKEPSGLVFHPVRNTLFVIGDEGHIAEILPDGAVLKQGRVEKKDFEGITADPTTGLLYLVTESKSNIIEISPDDFTITREFSIEPTFDNKTILAAKKNRTEAITFAANPNHPAGGTFFLARQSIDAGGAEISTVFEVEAALQRGPDKKQTAQIINVFRLNVADLSELYYNPVSDTLYAISDQTNTFFEMTKSGQLLKSYALPGDNQEGLAVDGTGLIYIAQDSGGILKFASMK
jgi:hypothetical protein